MALNLVRSPTHHALHTFRRRPYPLHFVLIPHQIELNIPSVTIALKRKRRLTKRNKSTAADDNNSNNNNNNEASLEEADDSDDNSNPINTSDITTPNSNNSNINNNKMPMPSNTPDAAKQAEQSIFSYAKAWGESPLPPTLLATLITAQHFRPLQPLPMLFPPILLFSSYLNIQGFKKDAAGFASAWSLAYFVLARRRKQPLAKKFGARGIVRGATVALCAMNGLAGGWAYWKGSREEGEAVV